MVKSLQVQAYGFLGKLLKNMYGCTGGTNARTYHSSERSQYCTFSGSSKEDIRMIREAYFLEHTEKGRNLRGCIQRKHQNEGEKGWEEQVCTRYVVSILSFFLCFVRQILLNSVHFVRHILCKTCHDNNFGQRLVQF